MEKETKDVVKMVEEFEVTEADIVKAIEELW